MFRNILRNEYIFSLLTKGISFICGLIQSVILARFLGTELKGNSAYISSIVSIGIVFFSAGMHQVYPYLRKRNSIEDLMKKFTSATFFWAVVMGGALSIVSLSGFFTKDVSVALLIIPFLSYANTLDYLLLVEKPNKRNVIYSAFNVIEVVVAGCISCFCKSGYGWVVFFLLYVSVAKGIVLSILLNVFPLRLKGIGNIYKECIRFGIFPMLALLMTALNYNIDVIMLKRYTYISLDEIGIYSIGIMIADKLALIPDTLKGVLASRLAKGAGEQEVAKVSRVSVYSCIFLALGLIIFGKPVVGLLYGESYNGAYLVTCICALGSVSIGYFKLISQYNIINKRQRSNVAMLAVSIILNFIGNILLVPKWGINGAAISTCIAHVLCSFIFVVYFVKVGKVSIWKMILLQREDTKIFNVTKKHLL